MTSRKIVAISDSHQRHDQIKIPECDFLIHCGDWCSMGYESEVRNFARWLNKQPARFIILTPGNHELEFERQLPASLQWFKEEAPNTHLLIDQEVTIEGIKFYGSPQTLFFHDWAFNRQTGEEIQRFWDAIADDTNVLITHQPPYGILDQTSYADGTLKPGNLGCYQLMDRIKSLKDLDLHFFGHIHAGGGRQVHMDGVSYYNTAICDERYAPTNPITVVDYIYEIP